MSRYKIIVCIIGIISMSILLVFLANIFNKQNKNLKHKEINWQRKEIKNENKQKGITDKQQKDAKKSSEQKSRKIDNNSNNNEKKMPQNHKTDKYVIILDKYIGDVSNERDSFIPTIAFDAYQEFQLDITSDSKIIGEYEIYNNKCILKCYKNRKILKDEKYDEIILSIVNSRKLILERELPGFLKQSYKFTLSDKIPVYTEWNDKDVEEARKVVEKTIEKWNQVVEEDQMLGEIEYKFDALAIETVVSYGYERDKIITFSAWDKNDVKKQNAARGYALYKKTSSSKWEIVNEGY